MRFVRSQVVASPPSYTPTPQNGERVRHSSMVAESGVTQVSKAKPVKLPGVTGVAACAAGRRA